MLRKKSFRIEHRLNNELLGYFITESITMERLYKFTKSDKV